MAVNSPSDDIDASSVTRLQQVRLRIAQAARAAGRDPSGVSLLAVSKTFDADAVAAMARSGQREFGENYVQEGVAKVDALRSRWPGLCWHFIGPLQSNKTRDVARCFDWVHSIDRLSVARRLAAQRPDERDGEALAPLQVCLQVNISGEPSKSGVAARELPELAHEVAALQGLRLRGLMCIPAPAHTLQSQREPFARLRELQHALVAQGLPLDTLSMGMSADLEAAVLEGATIVRVGSALFGERPRRRSDA
jgi:pyridoxal phosphate enzyme (YggS family)